jgi:hypothetical protein
VANKHAEPPTTHTDHRQPGAPQAASVQDEAATVRFATIRTWLRRRSWLGLGHERESALLKQVLLDYARVVEEAARRAQQHELTIARLNVERAWLHQQLRRQLVFLKSIGTRPMPDRPMPDRPMPDRPMPDRPMPDRPMPDRPTK